MRRKDITGMRFGRLVAIEPSHISKYGKWVWKCKCDCGNECLALAATLLNGGTKSCGCLNREVLKTCHLKHGGSDTRLYKIWSGIKKRCLNERSLCYKWYGGRGISVCDEWLGDHGFENFRDWSMKNGYRDDLSIDRIDNDGNYCPDNCRWADRKTQANNKSTTRRYEYQGKQYTAGELADLCGLSLTTLKSRLKHGWSVNEAVNTSVVPPNGKRIKDEDCDIIIKVKYHEDIDRMCFVGGKETSNWVDLRCAEDTEIKQGEMKLIPLGISVKLPDGYEAIVAPRSSTFKKYGVLMANGIGVIDSAYCGNDDIWMFPAYATRDTFIKKNDRICQFRILQRQPEITPEVVDNLDSPDRGGFGSTGTT